MLQSPTIIDHVFSRSLSASPRILANDNRQERERERERERTLALDFDSERFSRTNEPRDEIGGKKGDEKRALALGRRGREKRIGRTRTQELKSLVARGKHSFARANIPRYLSSVRGNTCGPFSYRAGARRDRMSGVRARGRKRDEKTRIERNKNITFRDGGAKGARGTSGSFSSIPSVLYSSSDRMFVFRKIDRNETGVYTRAR